MFIRDAGRIDVECSHNGSVHDLLRAALKRRARHYAQRRTPVARNFLRGAQVHYNSTGQAGHTMAIDD